MLTSQTKHSDRIHEGFSNQLLGNFKNIYKKGFYLSYPSFIFEMRVYVFALLKAFLLIREISAKIFNLIGEGKSINSTSFHSIERAPYQQCLSFCHHSPKCFSFEVFQSSTFTGCQFYQEIYNTSMTLINKSGVKYYSVNRAKDCAELYLSGKHTSGVYI